MTAAPQISVCKPVRNGAQYVVEALRSALAQRGRELEVVVYDDGSTDATPAAVASLADERIRYTRGTRRIGVAAARNACLAAARGEYVAWLDADDVLLDGMLDRQAATLDRHPRVGLVHGRAEIVDAAGSRLADAGVSRRTSVGAWYGSTGRVCSQTSHATSATTRTAPMIRFRFVLAVIPQRRYQIACRCSERRVQSL